MKRRVRIYNAVKNKIFRKTGNDTEEDFEYNEKFERVLGIMGDSHKNGLALTSEVGLPQYIIKQSNVQYFSL